MKTNTFLRIPIINQLRRILLLSVIFLSTNALGQNVYSVISELWFNQNWNTYTRTLNTYDGSNHLAHSISFIWIMSPGEWQNTFKEDYSYNIDGTLHQSVSQNWNTGNGSWENQSQSTFTYNASKKVLTHITEMWGGTWNNSEKETNTYNVNGHLIRYLYQNWDLPTNDWKNSKQINYTNNPSGYPTQTITQDWNASNMWVDYARTTYTYTGANKVLTETNETWTGTNWLNSTKLTNTYNVGGYIVITLLQNWDTNSQSWINYNQILSTYDSNNNIAQSITQQWINETSTWTNLIRTTYSYTLGTEDFSIDKILVLYPNPSIDKITIKTIKYLDNVNYFITDQTGRIIKKGQLNDMETIIDISQMSRGLYFFRIDENYKNSIKLIKN